MPPVQALLTLLRALTMTYYDELSIAEASSALRVPSGTYKARLFRARRLLQKLAEHQARVHAPFLSNALQRESLAANSPAEMARPCGTWFCGKPIERRLRSPMAAQTERKTQSTMRIGLFISTEIEARSGVHALRDGTQGGTI